MEVDIKVGDLVKLVPPEMYVPKEWEKNSDTQERLCSQYREDLFVVCFFFEGEYHELYASVKNTRTFDETIWFVRRVTKADICIPDFSDIEELL